VVAPTPPPQPLDSAAAARGRRDYERYCVWCHGPDGDGRGRSARRFEAAPRDFTQGLFKCRSTPTGALPTDTDLRHAIVQGMHGAGMPSWSTLSALQVDDLLQTIKAFSARWLAEGAPAPLVAPPELPDSSDSVARGQATFQKMQCATCHGARGEGNGPALATLRDDAGNPIRAANFTLRGALKCGDEPSRIYLTLMTGLNGTPMPSYAASLSAADAWDLVHYVRSLRHRSAWSDPR
jgi:mono/diheme cytochrome c family protein